MDEVAGTTPQAMVGLPRRTILFAISDTGGGHRSAAAAMTAAIELLCGDAIVCQTADILAAAGPLGVREAPRLYDLLSTHWLPAYNLGFALTNSPAAAAWFLDALYPLMRRRLLALLHEVRPDLVVAVHPLVARLIGAARAEAGLPFRLVSVVTDLVSLHAAWSCAPCDLWFVPTQEAWQRLRGLGVPAARLALSAFPVHPRFGLHSGKRRAARHALGIDTNRFTLLLAGGGAGTGGIGKLTRLLSQADPGFQILAVTGRNRLLYDQLKAADLGPHTRVYGFVHAMDQLMAACNLVVSKAGPGTLMEAFTLRRPVIVTGAVGLQEQGTINFVLNHRLGAYCPSGERLLDTLHALRHPAAYAAACASLIGAVPRDGVFCLVRHLISEVEQVDAAWPQRSKQHSLCGAVGAVREPPTRGANAAGFSSPINQFGRLKNLPKCHELLGYEGQEVGSIGTVGLNETSIGRQVRELALSTAVSTTCIG